MKICKLIDILNANRINVEDENFEISTGYAGDFLSFVMGKAPTGCAWFTVMINVNVAAVALLTETGVVVCCEGAKADQLLVDKCKRENINLIETSLDIFSAIKAFVEFK